MCSVDYYNKNAESFYKRTALIDDKERLEKFLSCIPSHGKILDAGCGVGRDLKYFLQKGYKASAFDASQEMVNYAQKESGIAVENMRFQDLAFNEDFDGVWANISLIHIPYEQIRPVFEKISRALKPEGVFYASFKYGAHAMSTEERDFYNMTENTILLYLTGLFNIIEIWKTADNRSQVAPSPDKALLHILGKKIKKAPHHK